MLSSLFLIQKLIHESFMTNLFRELHASVCDIETWKKARKEEGKMKKSFFFCLKENFKIETEAADGVDFVSMI